MDVNPYQSPQASMGCDTPRQRRSLSQRFLNAISIVGAVLFSLLGIAIAGTCAWTFLFREGRPRPDFPSELETFGAEAYITGVFASLLAAASCTAFLLIRSGTLVRKRKLAWRGIICLALSIAGWVVLYHWTRQ